MNNKTTITGPAVFGCPICVVDQTAPPEPPGHTDFKMTAAVAHTLFELAGRADPVMHHVNDIFCEVHNAMLGSCVDRINDACMTAIEHRKAASS